MLDWIVLLNLLAAPSPQPAVCSEPAPMLQAQFRPCVWPNTCAVPAEAVAQVRPCVWPNRCAVEPLS
ncbi:MAG: hypothetical protein HY554_15665 [Elusimicrobia bacterium]|nr:hypothetical protein [Elusimicrobiota bacterium]